MRRSEGLSAVAATGDQGATLRSLRDLLARQIESCESSRDVAALSRQLTDVLAQIEAIPDVTEVSAADEIAARRASRRAAAADKAHATV